MTFDFRNRVPAPPLDSLVEMIWYARGTVTYARERIAPTGSAVAIIVLGAPIVQTPNDGRGVPFVADRGLLVGPHERPIVNAPTGETYAVGIVTKPTGCQMCFGVQPASIRSRVLDLESAWRPAGDLRAALMAAASPDRHLDQVEQHLRQNLQPMPSNLPRCEQAVRLLEADPARPISEIAAELGVSHSHLDRELARVVGLSPRSLSRLLRLRRLLVDVDVHAAINWVDLAAQYGWFDQSHFIRDFKRHTGVTPSHYVAAQCSAFDKEEAGDAAGFVPER